MRNIFDPWNSVALGHQRAENRLAGSTSWRENRNLKLHKQYRGGLGGGERLHDIVGAGNKDYGKDGRRLNGSWGRGASGQRSSGQTSILDTLAKKQQRRDTPMSEESEGQADDGEQSMEGVLDNESLGSGGQKGLDAAPPKKQIFRSLCFYINGSTAPLISDHKLKYILAEHGATMSIALGRRTVTHVIVGTTSSNGGAGGGLAGSKIQKEVTRVSGKAVKFVSAEWVVDSIKAGRRLPETPYSNIRLVAPSGQRSVWGMFKSGKPGQSASEEEKS